MRCFGAIVLAIRGLAGELEIQVLDGGGLKSCEGHDLSLSTRWMLFDGSSWQKL